MKLLAINPGSGSISADGSYVSVPSPLGKIKSMTKGKQLERSDFHSQLSMVYMTSDGYRLGFITWVDLF